MIIASVNAVAQGYDVRPVSTPAFAQWYPVVSGNDKVVACYSAANGAGVMPVGKAMFPVYLIELPNRISEAYSARAVAQTNYDAIGFSVFAIAGDDPLPVALSELPVAFSLLFGMCRAVLSQPVAQTVSVLFSVLRRVCKPLFSVGEVTFPALLFVFGGPIAVRLSLLFPNKFGEFLAALAHGNAAGRTTTVFARPLARIELIGRENASALGTNGCFHVLDYSRS